MARVALNNLHKTFIDSQTKKEVRAVNDLNLDIRDGEFLVLVGPSGCGKSTALRMIAGLEEASSGEIAIGERVVNDVAPRDRNIAMVFQNYALYPHMSVYDNMAFGLKLRRLPSFWRQLLNMAEARRIRGEIDSQIKDAAEMLDITHLLDRRPRALSGGQRQRVALGRAIVRHPEVFLLDEPLSNLDAQLRVQTRAELIKLHRRLGVTTIYVTHDQVEAMTMGQRIAVMKDGVLQQCDAPLTIYHQPANMFVAGFIGTPAMNFVPAQMELEAGSRPVVDAESFRVSLPQERGAALASYAGKNVVFGIRPEDIHDRELTPPSAADTGNVVTMQVEVVEPMGSTSVVYLRAGQHSLIAQLDAATKAREGGTLDVVIDTAASHIFDAQSERAVV
ncbi:MAG: sn-glycerol-3-phosphate ABC transporter ATP-binding protein UgpC [Armatimonadetes bacterium]|nr:sn-glycerol-3-phosphate ABC transporter ATP-binding protein UgpC [Armatimonadota bacterium]